MARFAYLFERFPSFGQTFCYREVAELDRQDIASPIFSIRNPKDEPPQDWDTRIVERVHYLPEEKELLEHVRGAAKKRKLSVDIVAALDEWDRRTDFLRLYQAIYVGLRLRQMGIDHVHAHFAGMAARTAFWINKFFRSLSVLPRTRTTFSLRGSSKSDWINLSIQRVRSSPKRITPRAFCATDSLFALIVSTAS